jgi:uncharacterized membrane protein YesL
MPDEQPGPTETSRRAPSVKVAFLTLGRTLRHGYDNIGTLVMISLLWYLGALLVVPLGSVTAALHRVAKPISEERAVDWRTFSAHLRADFRWSSLLFWTLLAGIIILQANIGFYNAAPAQALRLATLIFVGLMFVWLGMALYAFPLALRQQEQRLGLTLRNARMMTLANAPGVLVSLALLALLLALLTIIPPLFLLLPGALALWGEENARMLLVTSGHLAPDEVADRVEPDAMSAASSPPRRK